MGWYGIDFGTTNSSISILIEGRVPEIIKLSSGTQGEIIPTVAFINGKNVTIGEEAKALNTGHSKGKYLSNFKTLVGENIRGNTRWEKHVERGTFKDDFLQQCIVEVGGGTHLRLLTEEIPLRHQGQNYSYGEITQAMKAIFTFLKKKADEATRGIRMDGVVIGIPVDFPEVGKERIIKTALEAGLAPSEDKVVLLSEPLGVALAYGMEQKQPCNVLVFDFGGGTLDLSLIEMAGSFNQPDFVFNVLAKESYNKAGSDFDWLILEEIVAAKRPKFWENAHVKTLRELPGISNLLGEVETCKIKLSKQNTATLRYPFGINRLEITRSELSKILKKDLEQIRGKIYDCIDSAKKRKPDLSIDSVLLAGGTSNIPAVKEMLNELFPGKVLDKYAGSGTGTIGLALAAQYQTLIQDIADSSYALWDYDRCEPIEVITKGDYVKSIDFIRNQKEYYLINAENKRATPVLLSLNSGKWQPIGKVDLKGKSEYSIKPFIEPSSKRISFLFDKNEIKNAEKTDLPFLEVGQIVNVNNQIGCIETIRHVRSGLPKQIAIGDMKKYRIVIFDALKNSTAQLSEKTEEYSYYDIGVPEPGEFINIKQLDKKKFKALPVDKFFSYLLRKVSEPPLLESTPNNIKKQMPAMLEVAVTSGNNEPNDQDINIDDVLKAFEDFESELHTERINHLQNMEKKYTEILDFLLEKFSDVNKSIILPLVENISQTEQALKVVRSELEHLDKRNIS